MMLPKWVVVTVNCRLFRWQSQVSRAGTGKWTSGVHDVSPEPLISRDMKLQNPRAATHLSVMVLGWDRCILNTLTLATNVWTTAQRLGGPVRTQLGVIQACRWCDVCRASELRRYGAKGSTSGCCFFFTVFPSQGLVDSSSLQLPVVANARLSMRVVSGFRLGACTVAESPGNCEVWPHSV